MYSNQLTLDGEDLYFLGHKVATLSVPFPTLLDRINNYLLDTDKDSEIDELQSQVDEADEKIEELEDSLKKANDEIKKLERVIDDIENIVRRL